MRYTAYTYVVDACTVRRRYMYDVHVRYIQYHDNSSGNRPQCTCSFCSLRFVGSSSLDLVFKIWMSHEPPVPGCSTYETANSHVNKTWSSWRRADDEYNIPVRTCTCTCSYRYVVFIISASPWWSCFVDMWICRFVRTTAGNRRFVTHSNFEN